MNFILNPQDENFRNVTDIVYLDKQHVPMATLMNYFKGWGITTIAKVYLLNDDESISMDIGRDVIDFDLSITCQSGQRRTLSLNMANTNNKWKPDYLNGTIHVGSKFRLDLGFIIGKTAYLKQMGIFLMKDPSMARESANQTISLSLCDKWGLFDGTLSGKTGLRDIVPVGVPMYQAFVTMVTSDRGNGTPFDMRPILFDTKYKNQMTYYTIKQEAGNTLGKIFTDLAESISCDIYYNEFGNLCVKSNVNEFINGNLPMAWHFTENSLRENINYTLAENTANVVNSVIVKGNIVNGYQFSGTAKNTNPLSPMCIQYRGELFLVISDQALYSNELCSDRAQYELLEHTRGISTISMPCPFLPIFDVNQLITVNFPSDKINNAVYALDSLNFSSNNGMSLTGSNIAETIFT